MTKHLLCAIALAAIGLATHPPDVLRAQADGLIFHELATRTSRSFNQNTGTMKPIVTPSGSIVLAELSPEWRQRPHHHEQEQVIFALSVRLT